MGCVICIVIHDIILSFEGVFNTQHKNVDRLTCTAALGCTVQKWLQALELESSLTKIWSESKDIFSFFYFSSNFEMIVNAPAKV